MTETLKAALDFADRGWPVLPVHAVVQGRCSCGKRDCPWPGKHPATRHGCRDATTNKDILKGWFSEPRNVGIATGEFFCALDLDDNTEAAWVIADQLTGGLPHTLSAKTKRGFHFYFTVEDSEAKPRSKTLSISPRIELIGSGHYVLVPPSQHKSWLNNTEPRPLPERILKLPAVHERRSKVAPVIRGVEEGARNKSACTVAGKLLGSFPEKDWHLAWLLLQAWNVRNRPPLSQKEIKTVFDKIAKRELRKRARQTDREAQLARALGVALAHSGLSQRQLAKLSRVSQSTVSRLLSALNPPLWGRESV